MEGELPTQEASPQRTVTERPLTQIQRDRVNSQLADKLTDMQAAIAQLRKSATANVGNRVAIGLSHGNPSTMEEALISAGNTLSGEYGANSRVQTPDGSKFGQYYPVDDFNGETMHDVRDQIIDAKKEGTDTTNTRFIGIVEMGNAGLTLGVVDTQTNTMSKINFDNTEAYAAQLQKDDLELAA
jgi:hypothetical protein